MKKVIVVSKTWEGANLLQAYKVGESLKKEFVDVDTLLREAFSAQDSQIYDEPRKRYKNVESFLESIAEKNPETGHYGHYKFPNDKWFDTTLGGKWQGMLLVKKSVESMSGFKSEHSIPKYCPPGYAWVDSAKVKDISFSLMDAIVNASILDELSAQEDVYTDSYKVELIQSRQSLFADVLLNEKGWENKKAVYTEYIKSLPPETVVSIYDCR